MTQLLLNLESATRARDAGCAKALANAPEPWKARVREIIADWSGEFRMEEIRELLGSEFVVKSALWGAFTRTLIHEGVIEIVGWGPAKAVRTHGHRVLSYRKKGG